VDASKAATSAPEMAILRVIFMVSSLF